MVTLGKRIRLLEVLVNNFLLECFRSSSSQFHELLVVSLTEIAVGFVIEEWLSLSLAEDATFHQIKEIIGCNLSNLLKQNDIGWGEEEASYILH